MPGKGKRLILTWCLSDERVAKASKEGLRRNVELESLEWTTRDEEERLVGSVLPYECHVHHSCRRDEGNAECRGHGASKNGLRG